MIRQRALLAILFVTNLFANNGKSSSTTVYFSHFISLKTDSRKLSTVFFLFPKLGKFDSTFILTKQTILCQYSNSQNTFGLYIVSRCRTRGESEDHTSEKARKGSTLALKPRADVTRSPKQGYLIGT